MTPVARGGNARREIVAHPLQLVDQFWRVLQFSERIELGPYVVLVEVFARAGQAGEEPLLFDQSGGRLRRPRHFAIVGRATPLPVTTSRALTGVLPCPICQSLGR